MHLRLALAALLASPACVFVSDEPGHDVPSDTSAVIVTDDCPGSPASVQAADVALDQLVVSAVYGGCSQTAVWACWDGSFLESDPVQALIEIHHGDAGLCDAALETTASIDLSPVIARHRGLYGRDDTIVLRVDDLSPVWQP